MASRSVVNALCWAILAVLLPACAATRYVPAPQDSGLLVQDERVSARSHSVGLTIAYDPLKEAPVAWSDRVVAFQIGLRNYGSAPLPVRPDDFTLLDEKGQQFAQLMTDQLERAFSYDGPNVGVGVGFGWGYDPFWHPWHRPWGWGWGFGTGLGWYDDRWVDGRWAQTLVSRSFFPTSPIEPGARRRGLIFFRGDFEQARILKLRARVGDLDRSFTFYRE